MIIAVIVYWNWNYDCGIHKLSSMVSVAMLKLKGKTMSGLAIAFPAEAAAPIARAVIDAVSDHPLPWAAATAGLALLLGAPLRASLAHAWSCVIKLH